MRILIEQHQYPYEVVKDDLWEGVSADPDGMVSFDYVGYFYNERNGHCVLVLPRVLLEDVEVNGVFRERVFAEHKTIIEDGAEKDVVSFCGFAPEEIIDPDARRDGEYLLGKEQRRFIREFAVWVYRAIELYWRTVCQGQDEDGRRKRKAVFRKFVPVMGRGSLRASHTLLDVILALREFQRENENFFMTVLRERQTGFNKINWSRTVSRSRMVWSGDSPIYGNPVNRRREIQLDEELFVIFHSILAHVQSEYGFESLPNPGFEVLPSVVFRHYLNGYGKTRLKQIKGKYFSDRALKMWDLCYAFFDHQHEIRIQARRQEYLLAKDFQIVFEAIIDELIGDKDIPEGLKEQEDGKRVDHMYRYAGLSAVNGDESAEERVYYIGDSKYYKRRTKVGDSSVYKQFTYARNVIQWNLDLFNAGGHPDVRKVRDDSTEGYAIVPNFFVSARIDDDLRYDHKEITPTEKERKFFHSRQFDNRLYDRDTLIVAHYNVNFLFVLSLYARNNPLRRKEWRDAVRGEFRSRIRRLLEEHFHFRAMTPKPNVSAEAFLAENFQALIGKVFTPYSQDDGRTYYSLALQNPNVSLDPEHPLSAAEIARINGENERVLDLVAHSFLIADCPIGDNPASKLKDQVDKAEKAAAMKSAVGSDVPLTRHYIQRYLDDFFLVGLCKDDAHFGWIHSRPNKFKKASMYNVRVGGVAGGVNPQLRMVREPKFLILYNGSKCAVPWEVHVYRIRSVKAYSFDEMQSCLKYPASAGRSYLCYELEEEVDIGTVDVKGVVAKVKAEKGSAYKDGEPIYLKGAEVADHVS